MERFTMFKNGKPSISMGHGFHGYVTNNQRVSLFLPLAFQSYESVIIIPWLSNHYKPIQPLFTIINHYQPLIPTIINHYHD